MISWGEYWRDPPYSVTTYCGICGKTTAHFLNAAYTSIDRDCYECAGCFHLVFVKVPDAPKLKAVLPD